MKDFIQHLPVDLVMYVINALLIFVFIRFLVYKPTMKFMNKRRELIQEKINDADTKVHEADEMLHTYEEKVKNSESEAFEILKSGEAKASAAAQAIIEEAKNKAQVLIKEAREQIDVERKVSFENMKEDISGLSIGIASKVLGREVREEDNQALINDFIAKVG